MQWRSKNLYVITLNCLVNKQSCFVSGFSCNQLSWASTRILRSNDDGGDRIGPVPRTIVHHTTKWTLVELLALSWLLPESCPTEGSRAACSNCVSPFEYSLRPIHWFFWNVRHYIQCPIEDIDFLLVKQKNQPLRAQFFVAFNPPTNYRCDRCIDVRKPRLRRMIPLLAHLLDK